MALILTKQNKQTKFEEKKMKIFLIFFSILKSLKSLASGKEHVRFPNHPDFDKFSDSRTGRDVR